MRVVFDTNVLLAGVFTHGICEALLDACFGSDDCTVIGSEYILNEFAEHAAGKFGAPPADVRLAVAFLSEQMELIEPADVPANACRDADDLPILGTLTAAQADCLVTGDRELLRLKQYDSRPILTPRAFHDQLA